MVQARPAAPLPSTALETLVAAAPPRRCLVTAPAAHLVQCGRGKAHMVGDPGMDVGELGNETLMGIRPFFLRMAAPL